MLLILGDLLAYFIGLDRVVNESCKALERPVNLQSETLQEGCLGSLEARHLILILLHHHCHLTVSVML